MIGIVADRIQLVKQLVKNVKDRYGYAWTVLQGLVKTDFRLRYQDPFGNRLVGAETVDDVLCDVCRVWQVFAYV